MSKLDKDQLDKISGGVIGTEKTENIRVDGTHGSRPVGVYWDGEQNADLDDQSGDSPSIGPDKG